MRTAQVLVVFSGSNVFVDLIIGLFILVIFVLASAYAAGSSFLGSNLFFWVQMFLLR